MAVQRVELDRPFALPDVSSAPSQGVIDFQAARGRRLSHARFTHASERLLRAVRQGNGLKDIGELTLLEGDLATLSTLSREGDLFPLVSQVVTRVTGGLMRRALDKAKSFNTAVATTPEGMRARLSDRIHQRRPVLTAIDSLLNIVNLKYDEYPVELSKQSIKREAKRSLAERDRPTPKLPKNQQGSVYKDYRKQRGNTRREVYTDAIKAARKQAGPRPERNKVFAEKNPGFVILRDQLRLERDLVLIAQIGDRHTLGRLVRQLELIQRSAKEQQEGGG